MSVRRVFVFAVVVLLVAAAGFSDSQRRIERGSVNDTVVGQVVGSCEPYGYDFEILTDYVLQYSWMNRYDASGQWVQSVEQFRVIGQSLYYNSTAPAKSVPGGPGEVEQSRWDVAAGTIFIPGGGWKAKIPHYGRILAEAGIRVLQCDPYTFEDCHLVRSTGPDQLVEGDFAALCDYLK